MVDSRATGRLVGGLALALGVAFGLVLASATPAGADVPPVVDDRSGIVSAQALPTVQIDGVVWDQHIVGNIVYVVGDFSTARPAGSAPGQNQVTRQNMLAYDITTGQLIPGFVANLNNQAMTVSSSPDGSRIYIGGQFTSVNGTARFRIAALDPATGAVITGFNAATDYIINDIVATDTTVYVGGAFNFAGGGNSHARSKLAAFSAANGAVLSWAPQADDRVQTITMSTDGSRVFVGGMFLNIDGQYAYGMGALDPNTGALLSWPVNEVIKVGGQFGNANGAILDLRAHEGWIYGGGYTWQRAGGNLEGVFKVHPVTGEIEWLEDCHGDTYQLAPLDGYVYKSSHTHFCGNIGGSPQSSADRTQWGEYMRHAQVYKDAVGGTIRRDQWSYDNWEGWSAPSLGHWFPDWIIGTHTGQSQATWAVDAAGDYVVYGGEFLRVNNVPQQGLVRFAKRSAAPSSESPRVGGSAFPIQVTSPAAGTVRVSFQSNFDRDDAVLTYRITRNGATVHTNTARSNFWDRPTVSFLDTDVTPGQSYSYRVWAEDPDGNQAISPIVPVTVGTSGSLSPYVEQVINDDARIYWRLGDEPGSATAADIATGTQTGTVNAMEFGRPGAIAGDPDTAARPTDTSSRVVSPPLINNAGETERNPVMDELSVEAWFRTTSTSGGRLVGFGNNAVSNSGSTTHDRMLYVSNNGRVFFGVRTRPEGTGATSTRVRRTVASPAGLNDGQWRHVVGTLSPEGMKLYVDGELVSSRADTNSGHGYYGYWRVGADTITGGTGGWTAAPSSTRLDGDIDEVAIYHRALTPQQVANHHALGTGEGNVTPTAAFTWDADGLTVSFDGSLSSDPDGTVVAWDWDLGDGNTATGVDPEHTYGASGTYTVILTVTDDEGATAQTSHLVEVSDGPPAGNQPPVAAFSWDADGLSVLFDGSGSSDPDGSVVAWAWDFGDGSVGSGVTAQHSYAAPGSYMVTLTVTDGEGATGQVQQQVAVSAPGDPAVFAADGFERSLTGGWGSADLGGSWTTLGSAANYSVQDGVGRHRMLSPGSAAHSFLTGVEAGDVLASVDVAFDVAPTGGGVYSSVVVRRSGTSHYEARLRAMPAGTSLTLFRVVNGGYTNLGGTNVPGLVYAPGDVWRLQLEATGSGTTALAAKLWKVGEAEPVDWQLTANDTTAALQGPAGVGLLSLLSGAGGTGSPVFAHYDDLSAVDPSGVEPPPPGNQPPVAAFSWDADGLSVLFDGSGSSDPDGSVVAWAWDFGDGSVGSGVTAQHSYAAPGSYMVTLTVTDGEGATGQVQQQVAVSAPGDPAVFAADGFERSLTGGWGSADLGGSWTTLGSAANYSVQDGVGRHRMLSPGSAAHSFLTGVEAGDVLASVDVAFDVAPTGGGVYSSVVVRRSGTSHYEARLRAMPAGTSLTLFRVVNGGYTNLGGTNVPGLVYAPGDVWRLQLEATGSGTTALAAKLWKVGEAEPVDWQLTANDTTAALQGPAGVGLLSLLSGAGGTGSPVFAHYDHFHAVEPQR
jgi:PKD repeat protein